MTTRKKDIVNNSFLLKYQCPWRHISWRLTPTVSHQVFTTDKTSKTIQSCNWSTPFDWHLLLFRFTSPISCEQKTLPQTPPRVYLDNIQILLSPWTPDNSTDTSRHHVWKQCVSHSYISILCQSQQLNITWRDGQTTVWQDFPPTETSEPYQSTCQVALSVGFCTNSVLDMCVIKCAIPGEDVLVCLLLRCSTCLSSKVPCLCWHECLLWFSPLMLL